MPILPYTDILAPMFRTITEAWIADMFVIEPHDAHVLSHPRVCIVDRGGAILFAATDAGRMVGTGALMPSDPGAVELTMGVLAEARGTGAGRALLAALVAVARAMAGIDTRYSSPAARAKRRSTSTRRRASSTTPSSWRAGAAATRAATLRCAIRCDPAQVIRPRDPIVVARRP